MKLLHLLNWILFLVVETLGNFVHLSLIWHERKCIDEQKRTLVNLLTTSLSCAVIAFNCFVLPTWLAQIFGQVKDYKMLLEQTLSVASSFTLLMFTQMMGAKTLYLRKYEVIANLNEYNWNKIIIAVNIGLSFLTSFFFDCVLSRYVLSFLALFENLWHTHFYSIQRSVDFLYHFNLRLFNNHHQDNPRESE